MSPRPAIDRVLLNTDGGSRGNPGISGIGFTLSVDDGRGLVTICRGGAYIGVATNNVAEYRALIWGLRNARALNAKGVDVYADSELLVKQLRGEYRVKNAGIKPLFAEAQRLLAGFEAPRIQHVYREQNSAADALANEAMDTQGMVGDYAVGYETDDLFSLMHDEGEGEGRGEGEGEGHDQKGTTVAKASMDTYAADAHMADRPATDEQTAGTPAADTRATGTGTAGTRATGTGTYTLTVKEHFDAAHALIGYPGQCRNLHGHTWDIEVSVRGTELDEVGIVYDFQDLKHHLSTILDQYDHTFLNEVEPFNAINATAENLARVIYGQLAELLPIGIELVEVAVWESPIARLGYTE